MLIEPTDAMTDAKSEHSKRCDRAEKLSRLVQERLRKSGYPTLREVECQCEEGTLTLYGTVPSYHMKQVAQTLALDMEGVVRLINRVTVEDGEK